MSAFAQHDELVLAVEGGPCFFCDRPILVFEEGAIQTPLYQILQSNGRPALFPCQRHWHSAIRNAPAEDLTVCGGVHTLYVHD